LLTMHSTEYGRDGNVLHDGYARWIRDTEAAACHNAKLVVAVSGFLAMSYSASTRYPTGRSTWCPTAWATGIRRLGGSGSGQGALRHWRHGSTIMAAGA